VAKKHTMHDADFAHVLPRSGQSTVVSGRWSVVLRPSVCPYIMPYECYDKLKIQMP